MLPVVLSSVVLIFPPVPAHACAFRFPEMPNDHDPLSGARRLNPFGDAATKPGGAVAFVLAARFSVVATKLHPLPPASMNALPSSAATAFCVLAAYCWTSAGQGRATSPFAAASAVEEAVDRPAGCATRAEAWPTQSNVAA